MDRWFKIFVIADSIFVGICLLVALICELIDVWEDRMARKQFEERILMELDGEKMVENLIGPKKSNGGEN